MNTTGRRIWSRSVRISKPYLTSESRRQAFGLLAGLLTLLLAISGLNVAISYIGRDFLTAIARRQAHQVYLFALSYLGVFAASSGTAFAYQPSDASAHAKTVPGPRDRWADA